MNNAYSWYQSLKKPSWAPPSWLFAPVWTVLYIIMAVSFGAVFYKTFTGQLPWLVALPFILNLIFNFSFTPIQFRLRNNSLASVDVVLVLVTLIWAMISIYTFSLKLHIETGAPSLAWVALVNLPYLLWAGFATVLQLTVTYLNR